MADHSEFVNHILELLEPLGAVQPKRMFGGYGLFLDGTMFALINKGEEMFLKADDENSHAFIEQGSEKFGKMPYYAVPTEALDAWDDMAPWAMRAVAASRRAIKK
ncbi:MAG: TfoX/Sxy family protein [Rhodospirillales bacterium]|nr:TfoX/Sxy family protein [Rhodospirillales bacterium]